MKKTLLRLIQISSIAILSLFNIVDIQNLRTLIEPGDNEYEIRMKQHLLCLMLAYPEYIVDLKRSEDDNVYLIMKSGNKILYDDKKNKSLSEKIAEPDLQDMMEQIYPLGPIDRLMDIDFDPGRVRSYPLLKEVYGATRQQVQSNLETVKTDYLNMKFNRNNNAAKALESVMTELIPLAQERPDIKACVIPYCGTFNYRKIAGTNLLSAHAFGIAIDLAMDKRDYWQWASREEGEKRLKSYPMEIVHIFEKNNFIWGGKWGHFDILHFEYRPEIIMMASYFGNRKNTKELWYEGAPMGNELAVKYIKRIDEVIR
ncbi:M15 family metallopeptidase [Lutispora thermophila]|uniref:D-alanyl-D-alanine carboxypeptidase n=1 Tax=Lutispora thermophila DSM 19022 TaxID=1122184 RepID=A0A1M6H2N0_9FIRM|nr:M15 family metallopeptidase [Lutispora thermophila]SHJ16451.1 D-alanyl-D-alanine carboxypeptidase [Lutispora thermophila DSM 19022]